MEDIQIIDLFWNRSEEAISETDRKYGAYCRTIAGNILPSREDTEECVSDAYYQLWNAIPPHRPLRFQSYLGKVTRNLALTRYRFLHAEKRGSGQIELALEELGEAVPDRSGSESITEKLVLTEVLNRFLGSLEPRARIFFVQRYWYFYPVKQIAFLGRVTESRVKMSLLRSRKALKEMLVQEGVNL